MDEEVARRRYEREHDPARVLALSDGVFAIIITLLVLEIHVPELSQGQTLKEAMEEVRPSFFAFLISFVVVAISWAGHRDLFALIRRTDRLLVWLNILYLLPLCVIPFGASLLSRYEDAAIALQMYGFSSWRSRRRGSGCGGTRPEGRTCSSNRSTRIHDEEACGSSRVPRPSTWRRSSSRAMLPSSVG
jgi:hypothetical protein